MRKQQTKILHFDDINECHEFMGFEGRTNLPGFHVYTLEETYPSTRKVMPPYTLRFYSIVLLENSEDARLELNTQEVDQPSNLISFQPPGQVSSWVRGEAQRGFILYFQPEFLSGRVGPLIQEFPFFQPFRTNVWLVTSTEKARLRNHFERLVEFFNATHSYRVPILQALLTALLYDCNGLYEKYQAGYNNSSSKTLLALKFVQLVEQQFLIRQTVQEYAKLLGVSPNYLSQAVSVSLGRGAYEIIVDRILVEAKKLLRYTELSIAEVASYLGFEEPTHFTRFFKRSLSLTPFEYRQSNQLRSA
jgi:AraC-like DNA-binding protein